MALVDDLLPTLSEARSLIGDFGLRPYTVTLRVVSAYSGDYVGEGTATTTDTPIIEAGGNPPKVRKPSDEEVALAQMATGDFVIGPITPSFSGGGFTPAQLDGGTLSSGETVYYVLTGPDLPNGALFSIHAIHADDPFGYMVHVRPVAES